MARRRWGAIGVAFFSGSFLIMLWADYRLALLFEQIHADSNLQSMVDRDLARIDSKELQMSPEAEKRFRAVERLLLYQEKSAREVAQSRVKLAQRKLAVGLFFFTLQLGFAIVVVRRPGRSA